MYLYNTTFVVEKAEIEWWKEWMRSYYIPTVLDTLPSVANKVYKLDNETQTPGCCTFSCQWNCSSIGDLGQVERFSNLLHDELSKLKGEKCLYFSTMMKKEIL